MQIKINTFSFYLFVFGIGFSLELYPMFVEFEGYNSNSNVITRWVNTGDKNILSRPYTKGIYPYQYDYDIKDYHLKFLPEYTYDILLRHHIGQKIVMGPLKPCIGTIVMNDEKILAIHKHFQNPVESVLSLIQREFPCKNNVRVLLHSTNVKSDYNENWKAFHNNRTQKEVMLDVADSIHALGIDKQHITVHLFKASLLYSYNDCTNITINHLGEIKNIGLYDSGINALKTHVKFNFLNNFTEHVTLNKDAWDNLVSKLPLYEYFIYKLSSGLNVTLIKKETLNCGNCQLCKKCQLPDSIPLHRFLLREMNPIAVGRIVSMLGLVYTAKMVEKDIITPYLDQQ